MKIFDLILLATLTAAASAQTGRWLDTSKDVSSHFFIGTSLGDSSTKLLVSKDYEVIETHEICATLYGYYMEKSQQGRYEVNFKGMRTQATFTFTTQFDAEHWIQKFCTPQSLTGIRAGRPADLVRKY